jgi:hypothetical protein
MGLAFCKSWYIHLPMSLFFEGKVPFSSFLQVSTVASLCSESYHLLNSFPSILCKHACCRQTELDEVGGGNRNILVQIR